MNTGNLPVLPKSAKAHKGKTANELLLVIDQLSKAVERVKTENETLKKTAVNQPKYLEAVREVKKLREELETAVDERKNVDQYVKQSSRCVFRIY